MNTIQSTKKIRYYLPNVPSCQGTIGIIKKINLRKSCYNIL